MTTESRPAKPGVARGHRSMPDDVYNDVWTDRLLREHRRVSDNGCWEYTGYQIASGYGEIGYRSKNYRVHRLMYSLFHGVEIDRWIYVCHHCDNKLCFRPSHLFLGTPQDNCLDYASKGFHHNTVKTHCKRGHEYTPENTYNTSYGTRSCRACVRAKCRRQNGWPEHLWFVDIKVPAGYALDKNTGAVVPAKRKAA